MMGGSLGGSLRAREPAMPHPRAGGQAELDLLLFVLSRPSVDWMLPPHLSDRRSSF